MCSRLIELSAQLRTGNGKGTRSLTWGAASQKAPKESNKSLPRNRRQFNRPFGSFSARQASLASTSRMLA